MNQTVKVVGQLPAPARVRLLAPLRRQLEQLPRTTPPAVLPLSRAGWKSAVADAGVVECATRLSEGLPALADPALLSDPKDLRLTASRLVADVATTAENLCCLEAFIPTEGRASTVREVMIGAVLVAMDCASGVGVIGDLDGSRHAVHGAVAALTAVEGSVSFPDDACEAAFGVAYIDLLDAAGVFSPARLLSAYYGRYGELVRRVDVVLSALTSRPPDLLNALHPAEALVLTERPLIALRTALRTRDLLASALGANPEELARPLREMKLGVDRSASSHAGMTRVLAQLEIADTAADRAYLILDLYRRMIESQLRPWAWTLLQIRGRTASKPPELASLREQLVADGAPLLLDAADAILPDPRNASAHEDYVWDDDEAVLRVGASVCEVTDLERATSRAYAFMAGAECAWSCMRASSVELARLLDAADPPTGLPVINIRSAVVHFGTNGLRVRRSFVDRGVLTVLLDELRHEDINPCFQAIMWASRHLETVGRFVVRVREHTTPAMDLTRAPLDATFLVWRSAIVHFSAMPTSTFLPANAWARLAVELPDEAALAVAWLAMNDAVHAYLDAEATPGPMQRRIAPLVCRLELIGTAVAATIATLPEQAVEPLKEVLELVVPAASWNLSAARGLSAAPAARVERRIRELYESWPVPAVLPTTDRTPLDQLDA